MFGKFTFNPQISGSFHRETCHRIRAGFKAISEAFKAYIRPVRLCRLLTQDPLMSITTMTWEWALYDPTRHFSRLGVMAFVMDLVVVILKTLFVLESGGLKISLSKQIFASWWTRMAPGLARSVTSLNRSEDGVLYENHYIYLKKLEKIDRNCSFKDFRSMRMKLAWLSMNRPDGQL